MLNMIVSMRVRPIPKWFNPAILSLWLWLLELHVPQRANYTLAGRSGRENFTMVICIDLSKFLCPQCGIWDPPY
jgi:hypothetical protein